jgi:hypothetical protein
MPAPATENAPTAERARRSAFISAPAIGTEAEAARAGARMYRALSTIERLRRDGSLNARQAEAGEILRTDFELGVAGARDEAGSSGSPGWYYAQARLAAVRRYQLAIEALGPHLVRYVEPIAIGLVGGGDLSLAALARRNGRNRQETAGIVKLGLDVLADHYELAKEGAT